MAGKRIEDVQVVFNGEGSASLACANLYPRLGVRQENLLMCDSRGVIYQGRKKGMNSYKERLARDTDRRTLADAFEDKCLC